MKMRPEHYAILKKAVITVIDADPDAQKVWYKKRSKAFRWDCCYFARVKTQKMSAWISENLYSYLDDTHIDTALKKIVRDHVN